ncbi:MAG TPA: tetratricopeptide repeat protein, partial [Lysobacter sp.]|nr:tetratricopeptide repeat protein [Lysobacter sp.]
GSGGGTYAPLSLDGADDAVFAASPATGSANGRGGRDWADDGARLLPLLMLLALVLLLRRPRAAAALLAVALVPRPSFAADLWLRPDQQAHRAIERGIERYRRGDFEAAAEEFAKADGADAHYDRGNALAKAGRLQDAVAAYDEALRRRPGMPDAVANRQAVLRALQRKPPSGGGQSGQKGGTSKQSQQPRACAPGDASCQSRPSPAPRDAQPRDDGDSRGSPSTSPPKPADATQQARADAAQRERMARALKQAQDAAKPATRPVDARQRERRLSDDAALQRVPDEPGSLLREKFRLEHERRQLGGRR